MSKEEILANREHDVHYYGNGGRQDVLLAMSEFARQEALAFNKWFRPFKLAKLESCAGDKAEWIKWAQMSDEDYYNLFIQSK